MNQITVADDAVPRRLHIDHQAGEQYSILAVATRETGLFPACATHDITIGRGDYTNALVIHALGQAPLVGAPVKRRRIGGDGFAPIWADENGRVTGGGFTTACVPRDWRSSPKHEVA